MSVYVVDSIMGTGKSSAAFNMMENDRTNARYLYVTPYLTEMERVLESCPSREFILPEKSDTKTEHIKKLLKQGRNIATTHALFQLFDQEIVNIIESKNYILVMDEVANVIEEYSMTSKDRRTVLECYAKVDPETRFLTWKEDGQTRRFINEKELCELGCLVSYKDQALIQIFPIKVFKAFKDVYILTYMFEAQMQKYYFDFHHVQYANRYVLADRMKSTYVFTDVPQDHSIPDLSSLIHIFDNEKLNCIGEKYHDLSSGWYKRGAKTSTPLKQLKANCYNFFHNYMKTPPTQNLWTAFSDFHRKIEGKGYKTGFIPQNMRASNKYRDRTAVAYLVNKFLNPKVKNFFHAYGITMDEDAYALSEMLQFIWRSAIRDGKEINVYIPSSRMRNLLKKWIEEVSKNKN